MCFDIFSGFDSHNKFLEIFDYMTWMIVFLMVYMFFKKVWLIISDKSSLMKLLLMIVYMLMNRSFGNKLSGYLILLSSLFIMLIFMNLFGLIPYVFSLTSHLMFTLSFSLPIWFSLIFSSFEGDSKMTIAHLVIYGSPEFLMFFLVVVETVSMMIRPITLSVRLIANMSAGHVVLSLIGKSSVEKIFWGSLVIILIILLIYSFYMIFEIGVSFIQSYVYSLLCILYSDDHPELKLFGY